MQGIYHDGRVIRRVLIRNVIGVEPARGVRQRHRVVTLVPAPPAAAAPFGCDGNRVGVGAAGVGATTAGEDEGFERGPGVVVVVLLLLMVLRLFAQVVGVRRGALRGARRRRGVDLLPDEWRCVLAPSSLHFGFRWCHLPWCWWHHLVRLTVV